MSTVTNSTHTFGTQATHQSSSSGLHPQVEDVTDQFPNNNSSTSTTTTTTTTSTTQNTNNSKKIPKSNPIPAQRFTIVPKQKPTVEIDGVKYEITVEIDEKGDGKWKNVTDARNWEEEAELISQLALQLLNQKSSKNKKSSTDPATAFEKAEIEFMGVLPDVSSPVHSNDIQFFSATVKHKAESDKHAKTLKFGGSGHNLDPEIEQIVNRSFRELAITALINTCQTPQADRVKTYLGYKHHTFYPHTLDIIKNYVYNHDVKSWERSNKALPKPGTTELSHDGKTYKPDEYGDFRFASTDEEEFKQFLIAHKDNIRKHASLEQFD